jgi:Papain family cysteine protease
MGRLLSQFKNPAAKGIAWLLIVAFLPPSVSQAQDSLYPVGADLDSAAYAELPYFDWYFGQKGGDAPEKISLRSFCPSVANQGQSWSCGGYAFGYGAMSILYNVLLRKNPETQNVKLALSPMFIYNQIKRNLTDCKGISRAEDAIKLLKEVGVCTLSDFDPKDDCLQLPTMEHLSKAAAFKAKNGLSVFPQGATAEEKIAAIKACLQDSIPVVVNMQVYKSFQQIPYGSAMWRQMGDDTYIGLHYLVIIGYDEQKRSFEVMNSWGQGWADKGFAFVNYQAMAKWSICGYQLLLSDQLPNSKIFVPRPIIANAPTKTKTQELGAASALTKSNLVLQGTFQFLRKTDLSNGGFEMRSEAVQWDNDKGYYVLESGNATLKTYFQLKASNLPRGKYVYVFSCEPNGAVKLHYPKAATANKTPSVSFMPLSQMELTIPSATKALTVNQLGDDYLCILYSEEELSIQTYLEKLQQLYVADTNMATVLTKILGQKCIESKYIQRQNNAMSASATVPAGTASVLPIVLKVTAQ